MVQFLSNFIIKVLLVGLFVVAGCQTEKQSDLGMVDKYNDLVEDYNSLLKRKKNILDATYKSSKEFIGFMKATKSMNNVLSVFSGNVVKYIEFSDKAKKQKYSALKAQFELGVERISDVELMLINQFDEIYLIAPEIFKNGQAPLDKLNFKSGNSQLYGVEAQHRVLMDIVIKHYNEASHKSVPYVTPTEKTNKAVAQKRIVLEDSEKVAAGARDGEGMYFSKGPHSRLVVASEKDFATQAAKFGFRPDMIRDSQKMATSMRGVVGMACTGKLVPVLNNLVSHMKSKANQNTDDLELALVIDYSGSMDNNIKSVLDQLGDFVKSLNNVKIANRDIKVGIVTFGQRHQELIELALTSDKTKVQATLTKLLSEFYSKKHSEPVGEASYYGLAKTAGMNWQSKNRQAIVITDEPSYSLQVRDTDYVNYVTKKMSDIDVYPLMVRLCN